MIEFFKKYGKDVTMVGALALMVICYYQRQDLAKLRSKVKNTDSLVMEIQMRDILISKCKDTSYGEQVVK
jgi:hypothetical protein